MSIVGTQVGSYRIDEKIGEGGMGTVYRGLEVNLDRLVAIKVLNSDLARKPAIVERFRTEARAQANLNHTNVAILYAFLLHEDNAMMVMEYVNGENFQQMVRRRGAVPSAEAIPLFRQALLGVGAAHRMGIVHRDIKPANIMVNGSGVVKVMDFGIAKVVGDRNLTRTGVQLGTVYYMSPEQVKGQLVDARSDIYALGVTLYELLTARVPFGGESEFDVLTDHVNTPPVIPSVHDPRISKGVASIVLKALEKKPADRFQTVEEFAAALEHPEAWEGYVPKSAEPVSTETAATAEINIGQWSSQARTQVVNIDKNLTLPPTPPKSFWTPARVGITSFVSVCLLGAAVLGPYFFALEKPVAHAPARSTSKFSPIEPNSVLNAPNFPQPGSKTPVEAATEPEISPIPAVVPPVVAQETKSAQSRYVVPAKSLIEVRLREPLDSSQAQVGQTFAATVDSPIVVEGRVLIATKSETEVRLTKLNRAAKSKPAKLEFELANITVDGQRYTVKSDRLEISGDGKARRTGKFFGFGSVADPTAGGKAKASDEVTFTLTPETPLSFKLRSAVPIFIRH